MSLLFSNKVVRLLLSISVSIWMAGACLFGCSNSAVAAEHRTNAVEMGKSCHGHMVRSHVAGASFAPNPRDMMQECPLVVNATAAISKNSTHVPDPGRAPAAVLPQLQKQAQPVDNTLVVPFLPNRGPTHLLCCVFLI
jgi:hypothetical protein